MGACSRSRPRSAWGRPCCSGSCRRCRPSRPERRWSALPRRRGRRHPRAAHVSRSALVDGTGRASAPMVPRRTLRCSCTRLANARRADPGFPTAGLLDLAVDLEPRRLAPRAAERGVLRATARARTHGAGRALGDARAGSCRSADRTWRGRRVGTRAVRPAPRGAAGAARDDDGRRLFFNVVGHRLLPPRSACHWCADASSSTSVAMGAPAVDGRERDAREHSVWPGQDPIGRRISLESRETGPWATVVGIARDAPLQQPAGASGRAGRSLLPHTQQFDARMFDAGPRVAPDRERGVR